MPGTRVFTVSGVAGALLHDAPNPQFERVYTIGNSTVIPVVQRTYYFDRPNRRLMLYDGHLSDMPLVDNVVNVEFSFFVDSAAASVARPPDGEVELRLQSRFSAAPSSWHLRAPSDFIC